MNSTILVHVSDRIATITLNRPNALNALSLELMEELAAEVARLDRTRDVAVFVIAGSTKLFAAGADVREMLPNTFESMYAVDWFAAWDRFAETRKPIIASVSGYALGGGCELAMMCDIVLAADTARFGQPEVKLGIPPGIGGSQRLTRAIGKAKAMEMCLTGRMMDAAEAERAGLVTRVVPAADLGAETRSLARSIAGMSPSATIMIKECINRSFEMSLSEGLRFERRLFQASFSTTDQKEGMTAFLEKRVPRFDFEFIRPR